VTTGDIEESPARATVALDDGRKLVSIGLARLAAREAYIAMMHAASALLMAEVGTVPKIHTGLRSRFGAFVLAKEWDRSLGRNLTVAYEFKQISDYGPLQDVHDAVAEDLIERAANMVDFARLRLDK
jgi:uncharacterized protein (UPF0332 family)